MIEPTVCFIESRPVDQLRQLCQRVSHVALLNFVLIMLSSWLRNRLSLRGAGFSAALGNLLVSTSALNHDLKFEGSGYLRGYAKSQASCPNSPETLQI